MSGAPAAGSGNCVVGESVPDGCPAGELCPGWAEVAGREKTAVEIIDERGSCGVAFGCAPRHRNRRRQRHGHARAAHAGHAKRAARAPGIRWRRVVVRTMCRVARHGMGVHRCVRRPSACHARRAHGRPHALRVVRGERNERNERSDQSKASLHTIILQGSGSNAQPGILRRTCRGSPSSALPGATGNVRAYRSGCMHTTVTGRMTWRECTGNSRWRSRSTRS
jgi:hypothetical protein